MKFGNFMQNYGDVVTVETGRSISIWGRLFLQKGNSYVSAVD